jgi:hypothetical protein
MNGPPRIGSSVRAGRALAKPPEHFSAYDYCLCGNAIMKGWQGDSTVNINDPRHSSRDCCWCKRPSRRTRIYRRLGDAC